MIRPITIVTFLLACGSGLYVYQSKHEVQLLDRTIEKTVRETAALREQSRLLAAEWTMLNDPERLRQFSDAYLNLKSISPTQFISLNDLDSKLPAPLPEAPPSTDDTPVASQVVPEPAQPVVASETVAPESGAPEAAAPESAAPGVVAPGVVAERESMPVPAVPVVRPVQVATPPAHPIEPRVVVARPAVAVPAEPRVVEQRGPDQRVGARVVEAHPDVRIQPVQAPRPIVLPPPRAQPVYAAAQPQLQPRPQPVPAPYRPTPVAAAPAVAPAPGPAPGPAPFTGSLLGMARGSMPAAPRPTPVNATYNAN
jgi:hypothetical protein